MRVGRDPDGGASVVKEHWIMNGHVGNVTHGRSGCIEVGGVAKLLQPFD
jgi:hypothetical protein